MRNLVKGPCLLVFCAALGDSNGQQGGPRYRWIPEDAGGFGPTSGVRRPKRKGARRPDGERRTRAADTTACGRSIPVVSGGRTWLARHVPRLVFTRRPCAGSCSDQRSKRSAGANPDCSFSSKSCVCCWLTDALVSIREEHRSDRFDPGWPALGAGGRLRCVDMAIPCLIDCDPGHDDAICLLPSSETES
jgi:hypothetical protein